MKKVFLSKDIEKILDKLDFSKLGKKVGIKLHFGERGCVTYINPELVKKVYDKIAESREIALIESNVLYRGSRTKKQEHIETAREHGFKGEIDILDGEKGEEFVEVDIGTRKVKLGKGIQKYDSLIVLSHFKGHMMAGFGGAFKNMGMGIASRAGKLDMHSSISPSVNKDKCIGCRTCIENCNANAIDLVNGKAEINSEKCEGCAMCIEVCPQRAVEVPWHGATKKGLQEGIVEYSKGVIRLFKDKIIYINVLENVTKECDCFGIVQKPIIDDVGILLGYDPVAIDKASFDLANKQGFDKLADADAFQTEYAEKIGLGSRDYDLVEIDD